MPRKLSPESETPPTFESAIADLEAIVEAMEHEQLPLEDLVSHYEKGSRLLAHCESVLQTARGRIELITLRNQNAITPEATATAAEELDPPFPSDFSDAPDDDNDIRLF